MFASFEYQDNFLFNVGSLQFSGRFGQQGKQNIK